MIISTAIQNIPDKLLVDYFVSVNLHPRRCLSFSGWIEKIAPAVKTGETAYFWNHGGYYYDAMSSFWSNITIIKIIELMYVIGRFDATPHGRSPCTKQSILSLIRFVH